MSFMDSLLRPASAASMSVTSIVEVVAALKLAVANRETETNARLMARDIL